MGNSKHVKHFSYSAIALAVGLCFSSMTSAQSADGSIFGNAKAKAQVQVVSIENGASRTIEADNNGSFNFSKLPPGRYKVTTDGTTREVNVAIGSGTSVNFNEIQSVTVTGSRTRNAIDVSSVESNTVFSMADIQKLPVGRNATSVALLAPGAVAGDSSFGNLASFGGASVAENGYYINGFDVTNIRNFTSYGTLPFDAIGQQQIKTGGYGAEFGRSLGGVVSLSTKRGTNEWKGGVSMYWSPQALASHGKVVKDLDADANADYQAYTVYQKYNTANNLSMNVYVGGPIIKDKLFVFGLIEGQKNSGDNYGGNSYSSYGGDSSRHWENNTPNGIVKLDWQINDNHRLEFTGINNKSKTTRITYDNTEYTDKYSTKHVGTGRSSTYETGGDIFIGKYTGYLMDNLTLSAQIGQVNHLADKTVDPAADAGAKCPAIYQNGDPVYGCWAPDFLQVRDSAAKDNSDTRKAKRIDIEYLLGKHTIRAGYDAQDFYSSQAGSIYSGGIYYRYYNMPANRTINGIAGAGTPGNTEYVRVRKYKSTSGNYLVKNDAFYVEDSWKVAQNVVAYGGVRSESFENQNAEGISFVKANNLLAPRLGVAWDVNGDATFKMYANAGRYYIPVAANTNIRATRSEYTEGRYYNFTGKDPVTLAALGLGPEIGQAIINGSYASPNPATIADTKLSPMNQDEYILGFQKALSKSLTFGVKSVYRKVNDGMDDYCAHTGIAKWAKDKGYANFKPDSLAGCMMINPGRDLNLQVDVNNDGKYVDVTIPKSYLGLAKYSRTYKALELSLDRPFDGTWGLSGSYVYSVSKGTAEGYVQSDLQQEDAGATQDFDFGSFTDGSYGNLPNDRTHVLKLYGNYAINDSFRLGANINIASGRKTSCIGFVPPTVPDYLGPSGKTDGGSGAYGGASSYYCLDDSGTSHLGHRGNGPTMPWTTNLNLNGTYTLKLENGRILTLQADIFNVFNTQTVTMVDQTRDYSRADSKQPTGNRLNVNYGQPVGFTAPRSMRLTARYEF